MATIKTVSNLTAKTTTSDTDTYLFGDAGGNTVKKITFANLASGIASKILNSTTYSALSTTAKTIIGAVNELYTTLASHTKMIGSTSISSIGNGTLTGAVSTLNTNLDNYVRKDKITLNATQQTSGTVLSTIVNSGLQIGAMGAKGLSDCPDTTNEWTFFWFGSQSRITVIANKYIETSTYIRAIYSGAWFNSWSPLH